MAANAAFASRVPSGLARAMPPPPAPPPTAPCRAPAPRNIRRATPLITASHGATGRFVAPDRRRPEHVLHDPPRCPAPRAREQHRLREPRVPPVERAERRGRRARRPRAASTAVTGPGRRAPCPCRCGSRASPRQGAQRRARQVTRRETREGSSVNEGSQAVDVVVWVVGVDSGGAHALDGHRRVVSGGATASNPPRAPRPRAAGQA